MARVQTEYPIESVEFASGKDGFATSKGPDGEPGAVPQTGIFMPSWHLVRSDLQVRHSIVFIVDCV